MVSTQWHFNPSAQRQSSAYPSTLRWSWTIALWGSHSASFFPSSSIVVPWLLITPLTQMGPERTAAIWGFWKAPPPAKAVTVPPRMTPVISKFKLLTKVVTTNTYCFSSSAWLGGVMGLVNSTPGVVVEAVWVAALIRLASWPIGWSSIWSLVRELWFLSLGGMQMTKKWWHMSHRPQQGLIPCFWCQLGWVGATGS